MDTLIGTVEFRTATHDDAEAVADLYERYFREASFASHGIVFSRENALRSIKEGVEQGTHPNIIALANGEIIGVVAYTLDNSFSEQPIAVLHTIYAVPSYRRTAIGRLLVTLACDTAKEVDKACAFYANFASGMDETATLENLFSRAGFKRLGAIMVRALP